MSGERRRALAGLDALNFVLADVRDGLGPYLAIYLIANRAEAGWNEASAGLVMTVAGVIGLAVQTPAGKFIDRSRHKTTAVALASLAVTVCCLLLPFVQSFTAVVFTQSLAAAAATVFTPAVAAISLGVVGPRAFTRRMGRNEAFNHMGNAISAALAGLFAWRWGAAAVFGQMAVLALLSIASVAFIPRAAIDDDLARGQVAGQQGPTLSLWQTLTQHRALLWFAITMGLFHLSNAAMLTSVGQLLARVSGQEHAATLLSICIVAAQVVMVPVALFAGRLADRVGRKPIMLAAFAVLALRGVLYPLSDAPSWLLAVQCLDGVGAGIFGVLFPVVIADLTRGSGQFNVTQGAVATVQGLGAAFSASLAGVVIVQRGYAVAFVSLSAVALLGGLLFGFTVPETRHSLEKEVFS